MVRETACSNARTPRSPGIAKAYEGTKPAVLKRFGKTDDRSDELI
jgi:L(+)-tartrate dehydratase beta subunit